jgi:hypothetical protein
MNHYNMPSLEEIKDRIIKFEHTTLPDFREVLTEVVLIEYKGEEVFENENETINESSITKEVGEGEYQNKVFGGRLFHLEEGRIFEFKTALVTKEEWELVM